MAVNFKSFLHHAQVVYGLNMQFDRIRVGAIAFATDIIDRFYMNTYQNKEGVINALNFYNKVWKFSLLKMASENWLIISINYEV